MSKAIESSVIRRGKPYSRLKQWYFRWAPVSLVIPKLRAVDWSSSYKKSIRRYGKLFLATFGEHRLGNAYTIKPRLSRWESPVCIAIMAPNGNVLMEGKLGFTKDSIIVEAIQGVANRKKSMQKFEQSVHEPAANVIIQRIEQQAYRCGFKHVKIRRPEQLRWYADPFVADNRKAEVKELIRKLYYSLARKMGYRKEKDFFVKDL